ncbi:hypothetical protein NP493_354g01007 [Ridgeia piscesae]|uniref:Uncharacterized protein n=1 Tax=Ridgeia piscesae TaxID=27915 RepID=A0AAD9L3I8_RIDPI|nr:hypothetical protein NP493_354g01007 [Ridgeia piscesae]
MPMTGPAGGLWPTLLAKAGFFYTKTADQVACFCCGGRLKTWEAGDSPMNEHKRFFPQCSFVTGRDSSNVPLGEAAKEHLCITAPGDCRQNEPPSVVRLSSAGLGQESVPVSMHKLQEMMLERDRLESYRDWPPSAYACPETLAKTSLYYTGIADHVRCAFCNVTLCDWKPDDVPLLKHLTSFPSCAFLEGPGPAGNVSTGDTNANIQQRSQNAVINSSPSLPPQDRNSSNFSGKTPCFNYQGACGFPVADRMVRARMDTTRVRCVLDKGYPYELVYDVIKHHLTSTGEGKFSF